MTIVYRNNHKSRNIADWGSGLEISKKCAVGRGIAMETSCSFFPSYEDKSHLRSCSVISITYELDEI